MQNIHWVNQTPSQVEPNSIYIIKPTVGSNKTQVLISSKSGNTLYEVSPNIDTSVFIKSVNGLTPNSQGQVNLDLSFSNGTLSLTGDNTSINLDLRYVKVTDYNSFKQQTESRLSTLETSVSQGLRVPKPFDANTANSFPSGQKGDTYKVTVAGTVSGINLEIGDTLIYESAGTNPYIVQANVDKATETTTGTVRLATNSETLAGTVNNAAVTPASLKSALNTLNNSAHSHTNKATLDKFAGTTIDNLTFNGIKIVYRGSTEW